MDKITEGLFLGDIRAASNLSLLKSQVSRRLAIFRAFRTCFRLSRELILAFQVN